MINVSARFLPSVRSTLLVILLAAVSGLSGNAYSDCADLVTLNELSGIARTETESHGRPIIFTAALLRQAESGLVSTASIRKSNIDGWVVWLAQTDNIDELRALVSSNRKIVDRRFSGLDTSGVLLNFHMAQAQAVARALSMICKMKIVFIAEQEMLIFQSQPPSRRETCESLSLIAAALGLRLEDRGDTLIGPAAREREAISKTSGDSTKTCQQLNCIVTSYGKLELHRRLSISGDPSRRKSDVTKVTLDGAVVKMLDGPVRIEAAYGCGNHADIVLLKDDVDEDSCNQYRVLELKSSSELITTERFGSCASMVDVATASRHGLRESRRFEAGEWRLAFSPHASKDNEKWTPDWFSYRNGKITAPTVSRAAFVDGLKARNGDGICEDYKTRRYGGTREQCTEQLPGLLNQCERSIASQIPEKFSLQSDSASSYRQQLVDCVQLSYQKLQWNSPEGRKVRERDKEAFDICLSLGRSRAECERTWGKHLDEKQI